MARGMLRLGEGVCVWGGRGEEGGFMPNCQAVMHPAVPPPPPRGEHYAQGSAPLARGVSGPGAEHWAAGAWGLFLGLGLPGGRGEQFPGRGACGAGDLGLRAFPGPGAALGEGPAGEAQVSLCSCRLR